ncbi:glycoside hydrolase family 88 protein [Rhizoctonia solani]|uniref:Glycoside hydrolase family 88 protein n=1 Tax=Rhizoctonia solani TaxID=456999 RepID=A0A8H7LPL0_9AGAM|nr:glycoside hydrolase family 88 protein [Rhizoctonia solani]KAF8681478.1 Glycosyl Hydrolase Family 88 [Rhizoctonia solani]QRW15930.1 glycoside hydrolase family 88 protein [Rhizoctonia solani]
MKVYAPSLLALLPLALAGSPKYDMDYKSHEHKIEMVKSAMLASIRTSWEQGVAADAIAEHEFPEYSVYGYDESTMKPFSYPCPQSARKQLPLQVIQFGLSAAVRQSPDGRLSQLINDALDGAALDGASAGLAVLVGKYVKNSYSDYFGEAALKQLNYVLYTVPRTSTGAISHRAATPSYWADAVYVGFPFIAAYGAATKNETLLQISYDQCRLYRDALRIPEAGIWAHIYNDDTKSFGDKGLWATGNAWAAKGMLNVATIIEKSGTNMTAQVSDLKSWVKEILDGTCARLDSDNLVPNYMDNTGRPGTNDTFGDAAGSALVAATAYRAANMWPADFGRNYTDCAEKIKQSVMEKITDLGLIHPIVDPVSWHQQGILGTEAQAFGVMMYAAWRDWSKSFHAGRFSLKVNRAHHFSHDLSHGGLF